jgi:hypothetical protein
MLSERPKVFLSFNPVFRSVLNRCRKNDDEFEENKPELEDLYHLVPEIPLVMIELNTTLCILCQIVILRLSLLAGIHEIPIYYILKAQYGCQK